MAEGKRTFASAAVKSHIETEIGTLILRRGWGGGGGSSTSLRVGTTLGQCVSLCGVIPYTRKHAVKVKLVKCIHRVVGLFIRLV